jgi:hypothetical protein
MKHIRRASADVSARSGTQGRSVFVATAAVSAASKRLQQAHQGHQAREENETCQQFHRSR